MDFVADKGPVKTILKGGSVIATEGPEAEGRMEEVLEAVRSDKAIREAPRGTKKYRPQSPNEQT